MIKIKINNDGNNYIANDDNGEQTIKIFQTKHFREPVISGRPTFLALTHL